jgi:hypothetical protein
MVNGYEVAKLNDDNLWEMSQPIKSRRDPNPHGPLLESCAYGLGHGVRSQHWKPFFGGAAESASEKGEVVSVERTNKSIRI